VTSAHLYLYADVNSTSGVNGQPTYGTDSFLIKQITSPWTETSVNWNNQPTTTTANMVSVPKSTTTTQNYNINITNLTQGFVNTPSTNYGFMYNMANEVTAYSSVIFASSNHSNAALHPKLIITYDTATNNNNTTNCFTSRPNSINGYDSYVESNAATTNNATSVNNMAYTWTFGGTPGLGRGLIKFDLSSIPSTATVTSANLYLYADINSTSGVNGQPTYGTDSFLIKQITTPWTETTVNWNNQPSTSTVNMVSVPKSTTTTQNYNINIINLAQGFVSNPSTNYGFMYNMANEVTAYSSVIFASSNHSDSTLHPMIKVCYTTSATTSINTNTSIKNHLTIYPNPANNKITIDANNVTDVKLFDVLGKQITSTKDNVVDVSNLPDGVYFIQVKTNTTTTTQKIIVQH
ncbi:MAG: DNRLRE domain-containing protein, partial [Bacteroidia bacterium]